MAKSSAEPKSNPTESATPAPRAIRPFTPRRKMMMVLALVYALWLAGLLVMYFTTVYPARHPSESPTSRPTAATEIRPSLKS